MPLYNSSIEVTEFIISGFDKTNRPVLVGVVILVIYIIAVLANLMNILCIICEKKLHKPMYLLICNLAVVDIVHTSSSSPTMVGVLLAGAKSVSYTPCLVQMVAFHSAAVMEMFALAVMAFDRLLAINYPFQYQSYLTNVRTLVLTYLLWIAAFVIISVMPATVLPLPHCSVKLKYTFCNYAAIIRTACADPNYYFNIITVISFFLLFFTFSFICLSYVWIIVYVKLSSGDEKRKMGSTCLSHMIVVTCFYTPLFVIIVLTRLGLVLTLEAHHGLMIGAVLGPAVVNPFVYCLRTKEIRYTFYKIFRKVEVSL